MHVEGLRPHPRTNPVANIVPSVDKLAAMHAPQQKPTAAILVTPWLLSRRTTLLAPSLLLSQEHVAMKA